MQLKSFSSEDQTQDTSLRLWNQFHKDTSHKRPLRGPLSFCVGTVWVEPLLPLWDQEGGTPIPPSPHSRVGPRSTPRGGRVAETKAEAAAPPSFVEKLSVNVPPGWEIPPISSRRYLMYFRTACSSPDMEVWPAPSKTPVRTIPGRSLLIQYV